MFVIIDLKIHQEAKLFDSSNRFFEKYKNDNNVRNIILKRYDREIENHVIRINDLNLLFVT